MEATELFLLSFFAAFIFTWAEIIASACWFSLLYTKGIVIYRKTADLESPPIFSPEIIEKHFKGSFIKPMLHFRKLGDWRMAFRKPFGQFNLSYNPIMHGLIEYIPSEKKLRMTGRLYWSTIIFVLLFIFLFIILGIESKEPMSFGGILLMIGFSFWMAVVITVCYLLQRASFDSVFRYMAKTPDSDST